MWHMGGMGVSEREKHLPLNCLGSCLRNQGMWAVVSQLVYTVIYRGTHMGCVAWCVWHRGKNGALVRRLVFVFVFGLHLTPFGKSCTSSPSEVGRRDAPRASKPTNTSSIRSTCAQCTGWGKDGELLVGSRGVFPKRRGGNSRSRCSLFAEADVPSFKNSHLAMPSWKRCEESGDGSG